VPSLPSAAVSAIATRRALQRRRRIASPPRGRIAAHRSAIFRRVVSSNALTIPLDYNTRTLDEMTWGAWIILRRDRTRTTWTDKGPAAKNLKSDGWTIVETTRVSSI